MFMRTNNLFKKAPGPIEQIAIEKDNSTQPENLNYLISQNKYKLRICLETWRFAKRIRFFFKLSYFNN